VYPTEKKPKTMKLSIIISLILSISIIMIILFFTIDVETLEYLSTHQIRYEFFFAAMGITVIYWVLWGVRLRILSNAINDNVNISILESTKIVIANLFLANITPSMAGGEPVRIHLLNKNGLSIGSATASVLGERLLDAIFLLLCVPFAFLIFREHIEMEALRIGLTIAIVIFILAVIMFVYALKNPKKTKSFLIFLSNKISRFSKKEDRKSTRIERINKEVDNFHEGMIFFLSKGKKAFIKAGILTAIFWITGWMVPPLILMGLGLKPFIIESCAAQILLIMIVMMPTTPGSAGVTEGGTAILYSVFIGSSLIGIFVILFRFITYHMGLIAGAIFQYRIFKSVASFSLDIIKKQK
jgi:uncharacterized protein (TIRG00374 family)